MHCRDGTGDIAQKGRARWCRSLASAKGLSSPWARGQTQGLHLGDGSKQKPWDHWDHMPLDTDHLGWFGEPPLKFSKGDDR